MITLIIGLALFGGGLYSFYYDPTFAGVGMILLGLVVLLAKLSCRR